MYTTRICTCQLFSGVRSTLTNIYNCILWYLRGDAPWINRLMMLIAWTMPDCELFEKSEDLLIARFRKTPVGFKQEFKNKHELWPSRTRLRENIARKRLIEFSREENTKMFFKIGTLTGVKWQGTIPSRSYQATSLVTPQDSILEILLFTMYAWYLDPTNHTLGDREDRSNDFARNTGSTNNYAAQRLQKITDRRGNILW
jgi:hypothetical protein